MENVLSLAKELCLVETFFPGSKSESAINGQLFGGDIQPFDYVVVIDFESTCWDCKGQNQRWQYLPEIIEFPAILLDLSTGVIESEFHQYVMPLENPKLSDFCTKLTGIKQDEVDSGVPLATCLMLFNQWVSKICDQKNISFHRSHINQKTCAFVTWSDWDLAVCLQNEVKRKQLRMPDILTQWIDLRALYRAFYNRRPQGLRGALAELGILFNGREHSGIADARNTAHLAFQMCSDGCILNITGCIQGTPPQKRGDGYQIWKQQLEETSPHIQKLNFGRQPLANINIQALLESPEKPKCTKHNANSYRKSQSNTRKSQPWSTLLTSGEVKVVTPTSKLPNLRTPQKYIKDSGTCRRTPPLCRCGRRAVLKIANALGPNQGRSFFSCSNYRRSLGMSAMKVGCGYFVWC